MTRWAKDVSPERVHPEYPRPTLVRSNWLNLNGLWDYAIVPTNTPQPAQFQGKILVPFPIESALSGVKKMVGSSNALWYRRTFKIPEGWAGKRTLLNFGAVDWEARVWVNGKGFGPHRGGYDAFTFDITGALRPGQADQELIVAVWDPTDDGPQPRGKQVKKPGGIWYTPTTGIWQTPWLEPVGESWVDSLKLIPNNGVTGIHIIASVSGLVGDGIVEAVAFDGTNIVGRAKGTDTPSFSLDVESPKRWSPDNPHLYDLEITVKRGNRIVDHARSYFGLRRISLAADPDGVQRMRLNNKTLFQYGPLDQGFWPDGLYTAPTDEALRWDIEMTKKLGFNMARKHVKVEPERWYYWCDKIGLLVWQDMPSGDKSARWQGPSGFDGEEMKRTPESTAIFERELKALIDGRYNHPCIVMWVPFNEGWGQFDTVRVLKWTMDRDPTRLVDGPSGGNHFPAGHIIDHHQYPGPGAPKRVTDRAMVLGEFGGLGLPVKGHTWQEERNWGYRTFKSSEEVTRSYLDLLRKLHPMIRDNGLSAAIYTQTTDVEVEVNGLFTYDRQIVKLDEAKITATNKRLYGPPPTITRLSVLSPVATNAPVEWAYTTEKPPENWAEPTFSDITWKRGWAGFGTAETPNTTVRTEWKGTNIWLRKAFDAPASKPRNLHLLIFHDEDAQVFLNNQLIAEFSGYVTRYDLSILDKRAERALKPGKNTLAVTCKQTRGGQYIDVGLVEVEEGPAPAVLPVKSGATVP
ncbi:MAG: glycoside hydrolase family 2 [Verrucomicrobia subdivision 3 bacterium]|nr:glycoside hydrolase family 2 [Limisphaerales bacterium]